MKFSAFWLTFCELVTCRCSSTLSKSSRRLWKKRCHTTVISRGHQQRLTPGNSRSHLQWKAMMRRWLTWLKTRPALVAGLTDCRFLSVFPRLSNFKHFYYFKTFKFNLRVGADMVCGRPTVAMGCVTLRNSRPRPPCCRRRSSGRSISWP